jgi:putative DNA primase/helicase
MAIHNLARADRRVVAAIDIWDRDPWLLNTPTGTIDLRTGECRPNDPKDYITKVTAVGPGGDCRLWFRFLQKITGGDAELIAYLQRVVGYILTGLTREQALFFLYGTGANGKSVFIEIILGILADYAVTASMDTFVASKTERHPTELAWLRGAHLVTAVETDNGQR